MTTVLLSSPSIPDTRSQLVRVCVLPPNPDGQAEGAVRGLFDLTLSGTQLATFTAPTKSITPSPLPTPLNRASPAARPVRTALQGSCAQAKRVDVNIAPKKHCLLRCTHRVLCNQRRLVRTNNRVHPIAKQNTACCAAHIHVLLVLCK